MNRLQMKDADELVGAAMELRAASSYALRSEHEWDLDPEDVQRKLDEAQKRMNEALKAYYRAVED